MNSVPSIDRGPPSRLDGQLRVAYRTLAFTTAVLLIVLVFVGVPLQLAAHQKTLVEVVGTLHGFLYIAYLFVAFEFTRRLRIPLWQMLLVLLAGTIPFCAFVAEHKLSRVYERRFDLSASSAAPIGDS